MNELEQVNAQETQEQREEIPDSPQENEAEELRAALLEADVKLSLLMSGAAKERLDEGAKIAYGLCALGKTPAEAAAEVLSGYPHLTAVQRDIPHFAAQGGGSSDGFAAIRSIFAKR